MHTVLVSHFALSATRLLVTPTYIERDRYAAEGEEPFIAHPWEADIDPTSSPSLARGRGTRHCRVRRDAGNDCHYRHWRNPAYRLARQYRVLQRCEFDPLEAREAGGVQTRGFDRPWLDTNQGNIIINWEGGRSVGQLSGAREYPWFWLWNEHRPPPL